MGYLKVGILRRFNLVQILFWGAAWGDGRMVLRLNWRGWQYSGSTNFRLEFIEPSAREVFIFGLRSREKSGRVSEEGKENMACSSTSLADSSISSRRKLMDTLYFEIVLNSNTKCIFFFWEVQKVFRRLMSWHRSYCWHLVTRQF